jgi:microcin C transport system substrate-binding protein
MYSRRGVVFFQPALLKRGMFGCLSLISSFAWAQDAKVTWNDAISSNPISLFPLTNNDETSSTIGGLFFENLLDRHWDTYEWMPSLANKWEISKDGKEFTFWLDPRAKFSDGSPVTPEDVKFSFDVIYMDKVESAVLKTYYDKIEKVEIIPPNAVKFKVKDLYYKNFDSCAGLTIFPKKHYTELYKKDPTLGKAEVVKTPLGSSEWILDKWDENQQFVVKRNPNYWNKETLVKEGRWNWDRHVYKIIPEQSVKLEAFKKGDLTMMGLTSKQWMLQSDGPEFKTRITKVKTVNKSPKGFGFVAWNNAHPVLSNKDVRWALSHIANLPFWIDKFDFGLTEPSVGPFGAKAEEHDPALKAVAFDLKAARKRLAAAGWSKAGKDGMLIKDDKKLELTITYPTQSKETMEPKLTEYKSQAAKVGVKINLKAVEWTSFVKLLDDKSFEGAVLAWSGSYEGDPKQIWHSTSVGDKGSNFISYKNAEVDKLIDERRGTMDKAKRVEMARRIEKLIYEDQPYTFMTEPKFTLYGHQNTVTKARDTFNYSIGTAFWKLTLPK